MPRAPSIAALLAAAISLAAGQQAAQRAPYSFHATSQLVVEAVTVTGRDGRPVSGLTAKDFAVYEDGQPQTLAFCEYQHIAAPPAAALAAAPEIAPVVPEITPEPAAGSRYRDRRLLVLYFDLTAMPVSDQLRTLEAAQKFLATEMQPSDLVAILAYEGTAVRVKEDFTGDRETLEQTIAKLVYDDVLGYDESPNDAATEDTGSAWGQDDSEFFIFNSNRQLAALQTAVDMLAPISEKKSLVYFTSGLPLNGLENQAQLTATEDAALRANVALFPVDATGLAAAAPMGDAAQGSPGGASMYNGTGVAAFTERRVRAQDTLYALAADTGGRAQLEGNDLSVGIVHAQQAIGDYYVLGYYTTNTTQDGRYRRVRIVLPGRPGDRIAYRLGYYSAKSFQKFTAADKERQLLDALMLPDPITQLTMDLEVAYFELDQAEYFVPIAAKIPGSELALAKAGGAEESQMDFIGEIKDPFGTTITNLRDKIKFKLSDQTAAQLAAAPIEFTAGFTLLPGEYSIKLLARDDETGRIGTYLANFSVPNLATETNRLPLSAVVLSSQSVSLAQALFNAKTDAPNSAEERVNPLVEKGQEILPSVTRVFSREQTLRLYAQAYERGRATAAPLVTYMTLYQAGNEARPAALETPPVTIAAPLHPPAYAEVIQLSTPLAALAPGRYLCQLTVLSPTTNQAAFWRTSIWIVR